MLYFCLIASPGGQEGHSAIVLLDFGVDNIAIDLLFDAAWPWAVFVLCYSRVFCHRVTSQNHYAVGFIGNIIARIWRQAKWDFWKSVDITGFFREHSWQSAPRQSVQWFIWQIFRKEKNYLQQKRVPRVICTPKVRQTFGVHIKMVKALAENRFYSRCIIRGRGFYSVFYDKKLCKRVSWFIINGV